MHLPDDLRRQRVWGMAAGLAGLSLALAACGPASQAPATSDEPIGSEPAASEAAASEPAASEPVASEPTSARCGKSADTTGGTTVTISFDSVTTSPSRPATRWPSSTTTRINTP